MDLKLSRSERETLKAVYRLTKGDDAAHTGDLAERLEVSPSTVTTTVKRLADRGLVEHELYRGREAHRRAAAGPRSRAIRRHRIVERFLADMLGYAWNEADRLATSFEHELPQEVEDRIFVALDRPGHLPARLPDPRARVGRRARPAAALRPRAGRRRRRRRARLDRSRGRRLPRRPSASGPAVGVEVKEKHPFDGPLVLRVDGSDRTLSRTVAQQVYVQRIPA